MLKIYPRGAGGDGEGWVLQGTGEKIVICVWESYIRLVTGWKGEIAEDRQDRLVPTIEALIEIQKRTLSTLGTVTGRFDKIDMEMTKITRQGLKLESELASFRSDATARLDAIGRRLD